MLPTRIFVILATVLSALMPIRASALNADQEHILMVAAMLAVADRWCADYRVDKQLVAGVIAEMGIDLDERRQLARRSKSNVKISKQLWADLASELIASGCISSLDLAVRSTRMATRCS
jgi:hypothetical protein